MEYYINVHRFEGGEPHAIAFRTRQSALEALAEDWMEGGVWNYEHTLHEPSKPVHVDTYRTGHFQKVVYVIDLEDDARRLADEWRDDAKEPARIHQDHMARVL